MGLRKFSRGLGLVYLVLGCASLFVQMLMYFCTGPAGLMPTGASGWKGGCWCDQLSDWLGRFKKGSGATHLVIHFSLSVFFCWEVTESLREKCATTPHCRLEPGPSLHAPQSKSEKQAPQSSACHRTCLPTFQIVACWGIAPLLSQLCNVLCIAALVATRGKSSTNYNS